MYNYRNSLLYWLDALDAYNESELALRPAANSWSIGQVYMHLLSETGYFFEQAVHCAGSVENKQESWTPEAGYMFARNEFPDAIIEGPPTNQLTPQPVDRQHIRIGLEKLLETLDKLAPALANDRGGKSRHPGLGYFNALQWLQFADMHLRHHKRQQQRLNEWLKNNRSSANV